MFNTFGNKVRIKRTPETEEKGLADKEGEIYGQTAPSMMDVEIIGTLTEDVAINVHFEELGRIILVCRRFNRAFRQWTRC